jgi:hypothetical protein
MRPQIIAGPAVVAFGGHVYYTEGDIIVALARETFLVQTALHGTIDERLVSQMATISFKPVGALDVVAKYLPYAAAQIGTLLIDQESPDTVVIWAKDGRKTTWGAGFVSQLPAFTLSATATAVGDMQLTVLGDPTADATDPDAWNAFTTAALDDASFDETQIVTPRWIANWGDLLENIESEAGFSVETAMGFNLKRVDNHGNVNALLTDLTVGCRFIPVGIDEDDLWDAIALQGADALQPGESLTKANEDLIITGGSASFTLHKAGPKDATTRYGLEPLRIGEVAFVTRRTATAGVLNPLFTISFS